MAALDEARLTGVSTASAVLDREIQAALDGVSTFPDKTTFVPAELATQELLLRERRHGRTVVVVYPDGTEKIHKPHDREGQVLLLVLLGALAYWVWRNRNAILL